VGRLWTERNQPGQDPTTAAYAILETPDVTPKFNFTKDYFEWVDLQFSIYGGGESAVALLADSVRQSLDALIGNAGGLTLGDGQVSGFRRTDGPKVSRDPGLSAKTNNPVYKAVLKYRAFVNRTRP
jgi:hypothetical protein